MTPVEAAWKAVLAAPADDQPRRVLADALIELGDPLGEFISLQLAPQVDPDAVSEHLARHARSLLHEERRLFDWGLRFSRGFVREAGTFRSRAELEALLALPVGRLVEALQVELPRSEVVTALKDRVPALVELALRINQPPGQPPAVLRLDELLAAVPHLGRLLDFHPSVELAGARSSSLKLLSLLVGAHVTGLGEAQLDALETLVTTLPFRPVPFEPRVLEREATPRLKSLMLFGALWPNQLEALASSELLRHLTRLDLLCTPDTGWYPVLLRHANSFQHLAQLRIRPDVQHPDWVRAVTTILPRAVLVASTP